LHALPMQVHPKTGLRLILATAPLATTKTVQLASEVHLTGSSKKLPLATQLQTQFNMLAKCI
jgi:hypothetical protein